MEKTIVFLEKQIKVVEEEPASLAQGGYKKQMNLLTSIKGIGVTMLKPKVTSSETGIQPYVAAFSSLRCNAECNACFGRLRSNGRPGNVAVIAVANKLVRQTFAVVTHGKPYVDGFESEKT